MDRFELWLTAGKLRNNMDATEYKHVVRLLVAMLAPYKGRVYDPCCGSAAIVRSLRMNAVLE